MDPDDVTPGMIVRPNEGGLSAVLDPAHLPGHPQRKVKKGKLTVFRTRLSQLEEQGLQLNPREFAKGRGHQTIEAARPQRLDEFRDRAAATREIWEPPQ